MSIGRLLAGAARTSRPEDSAKFGLYSSWRSLRPQQREKSYRHVASAEMTDATMKDFPLEGVMNGRSFLASVPLASLRARSARQGRQRRRYSFYSAPTRIPRAGIYAYTLPAIQRKGHADRPGGRTPNPSWLTVHPGLRYLYAVNEAELKREPGKPNYISSFALDRASGKLTFLTGLPGAKAHVMCPWTEPARRFFWPTTAAAAWLRSPYRRTAAWARRPPSCKHKAASVNAQGQPRPRGHCILASPTNRFVLAADLGWTVVRVPLRRR